MQCLAAHLRSILCYPVPHKKELTSVFGANFSLIQMNLPALNFIPLNSWKRMPPWLLTLGMQCFSDWRASLQPSQQRRASYLICQGSVPSSTMRHKGNAKKDIYNQYASNAVQLSAGQDPQYKHTVTHTRNAHPPTFTFIQTHSSGL